MSYKTRKRKEVEERKVNDGEQDNFFTDEMREKMETMWEIPQIFHFLYLTKESLNIPQLSLYEMERMLLIPRASKQLANIMTCLLSSPITKVKLRKVPPVRQDQETKKRSKFIRYKKRKLQIHNNLSDHRLENRNDDKDLSNNDSTTGSFISEDTNLSSISTCSNNNNIILDTISRKRRRSLSKTSEESSNARSSGYDTHNSSDTKSVDDESSPMFKGFTNTQNDNCSIGIINEMLHDLKTEIDEEKKMSERESSNELVSQENLVELYKNTVISCGETFDEKDENEKSGDTLSNSSKTDDEKLNEIINAESSKLFEDVYSKNIPASDVSDISMNLTSKSDDEKLSETKTSDSNVSTNENSLNKKRTFELFYSSSSINSASLSEEVTRQYLNKTLPVIEAESNNLREGMKLRSRNVKQYNKKHTTGNEINERQEVEDDQMNETDEENLNEPRLQTSMEYDLDNDANNIDIDYNLQTSTDPKTDECKQRFDKMLSDLSVSDFYLVVDSIEELRDLIANFSESDLESNNSSNAEIIPLCEVKLVKKLTELLSSVEPVETTLKDAMRKAKAKLQREWSNFKEGSVEDQDSSGESGLSSNWWVLGTQGRDPLSIPGDATLQTLPQSAVSPLGTKNTQKQSQVESENESTVKESKQSHHESREPSNERQNGNGNKQSEIKAASGRNEVVEEEKKLEIKQDGENENASDEDANQETQHSRRVLRARGISSYTEQLYSDDESDEDELEEWADVEAVYAAPGTQANTSASHTNSKERNADNWSDEEDSDQDWILPSSRKRKNKRSSTNRRLKSFEHKVQNITENTSQSNTAFDVSHPNAKIVKDKLKDKLKDNKREPENAAAPQILGNTASVANKNKREVPSMDTICKIESVKSVHSELDIKDEGPMYESNPNATSQQYEQSNYEPTNTQQKYYYMVPQNSGMVPQGAIIQGTVPQAPHATYYMQQPYVIQTPQSKYLPPTQQQQFVYQQQSPQIMAQPYVNNTNYVSYVAVATQPQTEYMVAPGPMINQLNSQNPVHCTPRLQNRYMQNNRQLAPRQNSQHFNGSVIRSIGTPVRGQRPTNSKNVPLSRQRQKTSQTSSTENSGQKVTSLIMLSDSDDEIEMIIMEKTPNTSEKTPTNRARSLESQRIANQSRQKPTITSDITVPSTKGILSPQIIQRMSQGGISITPVKNNPPPTTNANTQLVVVVNETGSHYALALPNGSKLILTPEQVAQIRASNGGKLIL
ncbi:PREDICTED: putative uncharacterized protein DDB_G0286901 [Atta cephalotes]|uniref:Uncharacterized bromodomain-containing protein 10 helical domain-containing protein n=1 Tax=Atta cephalotes TaxID=12957 RepID=A0A158NBE0_ATTCE|nr:PREDICTED: putative uncharacterized protein DDB_G0286901 [Atta cephalotes]